MNLKANQLPILTTLHHFQTQTLMKVIKIQIIVKDYFQIDQIVTQGYLNLKFHLILAMILLQKIQ